MEINQTTGMVRENQQKQSFLRKWGSLVVLSLALAIIIIDTTLLNVSLRTIINDLKTDIESIQWVITAYSLMLAAFTITGGRLGDLFGRKKMFVSGAVIFAIGSFLASISRNVPTLIIGESIIEGVGAALMMPATASLLIANFKGRDRSIAFGVWGGIAAAASAIGPILGGFLTTNYSWRWGFRINVVVVALLLIGSFLIRESRDKEEKPSLDFMGVILSALGLLSIVFGFIKATDYGWVHAKQQLILFGHALPLGDFSAVPVFIGLGLLILAGFALWERRVANRGNTPLVSLDLFRNRQFISGAGTTAILSLGMAGLIFSIPVFLQAVRNLDAFHTGIAMLPLSISLLVAAPLSAYLVKFISPKRLVQIGLALDVVAFILMRQGLTVASSEKDLVLGFILFGIGGGFMNAQISNLTLSAVSVEEAGEASGVNNTFRQVGSTLGSAILGAVLISALSANLASGISGSRIIPEQVKSNLTSAIAKQTSNIEFGTGAQISGVPSSVRGEIESISKQAIVDANKKTLTFAAIFVAFGLLISLFLPGGQDIEKERSAAVHALSEKKKRTKKTKVLLAAGALLLLTVGTALGFRLGRNQSAPASPVPPPSAQVLGASSTGNPAASLEPAQAAAYHSPATGADTLTISLILATGATVIIAILLA
ncbi:MAG: DHA2 family efflux MFS transporter permease subunit [Candidatus Saccharibacteria bacterium]